MIKTNNRLLQPIVATGEAQHTLPREINLGTHYLVLKGEQGIELMRTEQEQTKSEYVLCLDAVETYRLMLALQESFHVKTEELRDGM